MSYPTIHGPDFTTAVWQRIGYGTLIDTVKCQVKERLNGDYYLEMKYPIDGHWAEYLVVKNIICVKANYVDDKQAFRIVEVSESIDGMLEITANHITYDLEGVPIPPFRRTTDAFGLFVFLRLEVRKPLGMFRIGTDKVNEGTMSVGVPSSLRSWFYGKEGSIVDVFKGDWHFDNNYCKLLRHRGSDKGITVRYGKNLLDFDRTDSDENQYTAIWAYYHYAEPEGETRTVVGDILDTGMQNIPDGYNKVLCLDATDHFENEPTKQQLNDYATSYAQNNDLSKIKEKLSASFVPTDDIAGEIAMGDTITVIHRGVTFKARIRETVWDALQDKFVKITIGEVEETLADAVRSTQIAKGTTRYMEPETEDSGS